MGRASGETGMTVDERVSAAIDNELSADDCRNLIEELGSQPEIQHAWERFHTIDAMLRGEDVDTRNRLPWDRIHANFASAQPAISGGVAKIIDFASLRQQFAAKWVGGAALAASVVLGVSLFVALQQPGISMQGQYATENEPLTQTLSDSTPPDALITKQIEEEEQVLTETQNPDFQLASDTEPRQSPVIRPSNRSPAPQNRPNRELVRFVSE